MALQDILQKIDDETKDKIRILKAEYHQKIEKVRKDNNLHADDLKDMLQNKLNKKVDETKNRIITATLLEERKRLLKSKTDSINEILDLLKEKIHNLPDKDKREIFEKFILENLETGDEVLVIDKTNKWLDESFLKNLEKSITTDKKSKLKLEKEDLPGIEDGLIIKSEFYEINLTIDSIIKEKKDWLKTFIARELFK